MMGEPDSDKPNSQLLKRRKTGSNILRRLSLTGNKKRESIIYKQMKDDEEVDEMLLDPDDGSNVRFKRSIIQINRSSTSTPIKDPATDKPGLFQRFRQSFRRRPAQRSHSSSPNSAYDPLESDEEGDKEKCLTPDNDDDVINDVIATEEAEEYQNKIETNEEHEILSDHSSPNDSVEGRTAYKFSSQSTPNRPNWKQRLYSSFRKSKKSSRSKSITSDTESPVPLKRRYSLPTFKRKKKGVNYEAL
ncbi:uncharacterized protein LOC134812717 [Bolinopsis microptera]|uniref:uncharacterized protein LOC134812717 n=1 Tax=Bolinopsis microptera TaxID=2820187 RepID=UPI003079B9DC